MMSTVILVWYKPTNKTVDALWGVYMTRKAAERAHDFILVNGYGSDVRLNEEEIIDAE